MKTLVSMSILHSSISINRATEEESYPVKDEEKTGEQKEKEEIVAR